MSAQRRMPGPWSHRLIAGVTAAICTVGGLSVAQPSGAVAAEAALDSETLVHIENAGAPDALLCASPDDVHVWVSSDPSDPYCEWERIGDEKHATFFNPAKGLVLTAPDTNGPVRMTDLVFPTPAAQAFSSVEPQGDGTSALMSFGNSSDFLYGGGDEAGVPTALPVQTRRWQDDDPLQFWRFTKVADPLAGAARSATAVYARNAEWTDRMLCADPRDGTVRLRTDETDPACEWLPFGRTTSSFVLYNPEYGKVMTYPGGGGKRLAMKDLEYPNTSGQLWNGSGTESGDAHALRWFGDGNQNVDAGITAPTTGPVGTSVWRPTVPKPLTWSFEQVKRPTAVVTLGDSFMSGEGGRWKGNSDSALTSHDGTDRAYTGWGLHYPREVYGSSYDNACNRSDSAEAHSSGLLDVQVDLACSGATTLNVIRADEGGEDFKGEAPQADQLLDVAREYDVRLIALSIGGNDLNFADIIKACVKSYVGNGDPCYRTQQAGVAKNIDDTRRSVEAAIASIRRTMGEAGYKTGGYRIVLQSAPSPIPYGDDIRYDERWNRLSEGGCPFWDDDADWARGELVSEISDMLGTAAQHAKVDFLDLRDALNGREVCARESELVTKDSPPDATRSEWARFLVSGTLQGQRQESFHPNYFGQLALGRCLALFAGQSQNRRACNNTPKRGSEGMYLSDAP